MINGHILRVNKYKGFGNMIQMPRFLDQYPVRLLQDPALNRTDHFKMRDKNNSSRIPSFGKLASDLVYRRRNPYVEDTFPTSVS